MYGCRRRVSTSMVRKSAVMDGVFSRVTRDATVRHIHVATALKPFTGSTTAGSVGLSRSRKRHYSFVVKTTESAPPAADPETDQLIIQRVLGGDRDAFRTLIGRYSDPLYRHALCMTGSPDVA